MIRFLIDQFRQMPGPLKQPRILVADLAEEIIDLAKHYINSDDNSLHETYISESTSENTHENNYTQKETSTHNIETKPSITINTDARNTKKQPSEQFDSDKKTPPPMQIDPQLAAAINVPTNKRKQAFKVLAILWDANKRNMDEMSAKSISRHGELLGLSIRHENVRKVIRIRLEKYVNVHAQGVGNGTVYRYVISTKGSEYFTSTYYK